ncbi:MAG: hypothetical protein C4539_14540 [Ignavibacteriales bacterium]|nr:MAG: hypothetical protein C4539_14540 [Ignavibacteriales bacterium]
MCHNCDELLELKKLSNETFKQIGDDLFLLKKDNIVEVVNGKQRTLKVKELVSELHADSKYIKKELDDIKRTILFLIDFSKLHYLLKKYKLYYIIIAVTVVAIGGVSLKDLIMKIFG